MNYLQNGLITYITLALIIGLWYSRLYQLHYMPKEVRNATRGEKMRVYAILYTSATLLAPYSLYEIIKIYKNGGFKK